MQRFAVPERFAAEIERLMRHPVFSLKQPEEATDFARKNGGLLVGWNWSFIVLRPSGEVVDWDPPSPPETVTSYSRYLQVLGAASQIYPSLFGFIPERPADASSCHFCRGTGAAVSTSRQDLRCPMCGGLRWLPAKAQQVGQDGLPGSSSR